MPLIKMALTVLFLLVSLICHVYASCDIELSSPGNISSPGYPDDYPYDVDWCALLTAPPDYDIILTVHDFDLEVSGSCSFDSLTFYDADSADPDLYIGTYCGRYISSQLQSTNPNLFIHFTTDDSDTGRGFDASFDFIERDPISECGTQTVELDPEPSIVGGKPAQEGEWPWQATHLILDSSYDEWYFNCGASLLSPDWIITAAHCISSITEPFTNAYLLGANDIQNPINGHQQFAEVEKVYVHPNYSQDGDDWDLALMKLTHPVIITDYVRTVCIPVADMAPLFDVGTVCTITGWGATEEGGYISTDLLEVDLPIVDQETCSEAYSPDPITGNMICAGIPEGGKDSCQGDSGGPMVSKVNETWFLPGVVSWGYGCAREGIPGVYARVTAFEDWIEPVFEGNTPEEYKCQYGEYKCLDGWCIDYSMKCNDNFDGCNDGSDEYFCDGNLQAFDTFLYVQLHPSSVRHTLTVGYDAEICATVCLEMSNFTCLAFDIYFNESYLLCSFAGSDFQLQTTDDANVLNFQIQKMPLPGSTLTSPTGRFATPKWLPTLISKTSSESFFWIIGYEGYTDIISLQFLTVHHGDQFCSNPITTNEFIMRSGAEQTSPVRFQYCLNELQLGIPLVVENSVVRVEFNTFDSEEYGFIAEYTTGLTCSEQHEEPGTISSPNYPNNYPNDVECGYKIISPINTVIHLEILDFDLEPGVGDYSYSYSYSFSSFSYSYNYDFPECPFDYLSVYDGSDANDNQLIGAYCGSDIPSSFQSTGRHIYLKFKTDYSITERGFEASFTFVEDEVPEPDSDFLIWVYVGAGVVGVLLLILIGAILYKVCSKDEHTTAGGSNKQQQGAHDNAAIQMD